MPDETVQQIESSAASEKSGVDRAHAPIATAMISKPASRVGQSYRVTVNRKQTLAIVLGAGSRTRTEEGLVRGTG